MRLAIAVANHQFMKFLSDQLDSTYVVTLKYSPNVDILNRDRFVVRRKERVY